MCFRQKCEFAPVRLPARYWPASRRAPEPPTVLDGLPPTLGTVSVRCSPSRGLGASEQRPSPSPSALCCQDGLVSGQNASAPHRYTIFTSVSLVQAREPAVLPGRCGHSCFGSAGPILKPLQSLWADAPGREHHSGFVSQVVAVESSHLAFFPTVRTSFKKCSVAGWRGSVVEC